MGPYHDPRRAGVANSLGGSWDRLGLEPAQELGSGPYQPRPPFDLTSAERLQAYSVQIDLTVALPHVLERNAKTIHQRHEQVGHRCVFGKLEMSVPLDARTAAQQHDRQV